MSLGIEEVEEASLSEVAEAFREDYFSVLHDSRNTKKNLCHSSRNNEHLDYVRHMEKISSASRAQLRHSANITTNASVLSKQDSDTSNEDIDKDVNDLLLDAEQTTDRIKTSKPLSRGRIFVPT